MLGGVDDLTAGLKTAHVRPQAEQVDRGIARRHSISQTFPCILCNVSNVSVFCMLYWQSAAGTADGLIFGRNYVDGLPAYDS